MKKLSKALSDFLKTSGLYWIEDYIKVKSAVESVLSSYGEFEFLGFRNGVAFVYMKERNPQVVSEIHYSMNDIIRTINRIVGKELVIELRIKFQR